MYNNTSMKIKLYYFCFFVQHFAWLRAASDNMFSSNWDWLLVLQHIHNHDACSTERWNYFHTLPWLVEKTFFLSELNMYRMCAICSRGMSIVLAVKRSQLYYWHAWLWVMHVDCIATVQSMVSTKKTLHLRVVTTL